MAAKGLALVSTGWCRYDIEGCLPGEYSIRLELLKEEPSHPESVKYMEFLEETGAEHVATFANWVYQRKKTADGEFQLFSDTDSRVRHLPRIIRLVGAVTGVNLNIGFYNLFLLCFWGSGVNLLGLINLALALLGLYGVYKLSRKRKMLKEEQIVFE